MDLNETPGCVNNFPKVKVSIFQIMPKKYTITKKLKEGI